MSGNTVGRAAALAVAAGLAFATSSAHADGYRHGSIKDDPIYVAPFSWTGLYVGGHAGLGVGNTEATPTDLNIGGFGPGAIPAPIAAFFTSDYDMSGGVYGAHLGYNYQTGNFVLGVEGSISGPSLNGDGPALLGLIVAETELEWMATMTGRVGYAMGQSLFYAKGGVAWGEVESGVRLGGVTVMEGSENHVGWTLGAGYEYAFNSNFTVRVEYMHTDLGSENHTLSYNGAFGPAGIPITLGADVDMTVDTLTLGASYKF